jgi:hypothetical protein
MTVEAFASINGQRLRTLRLVVGNRGPWFAECEFEDAPDVSGKITIKVGMQELIGTVVPQQAGTFAEQRKFRVVAGGAGWGSMLAAKAYHNDAGVKAQLVAADAARDAGETLGTFIPAAERLGIDFVRHAALASSTLEKTICDEVTWWVDYAGITQAGLRAEASVDVATYELLAFDPRTRLATLAVDETLAVGIGSILTERLDGPQTVRDLELRLEDGQLRMTAWCGGSAAEAGRLSGLLQAIARRATDGLLLGKYRYRVVRMAADGRVELQAVRRAAGLPDLQPISMWPGVAGAHAELAPSAEVLVEFIEGDRTQPIITHFAGKDGNGFVPISLSFCGSAQAAARQGDLTQSGGVGTLVTIMPVPPAVPAPPNAAVVCGVPHLISFGATVPTLIAADPLYGAVSTGSPKVSL